MNSNLVGGGKLERGGENGVKKWARTERHLLTCWKREQWSTAINKPISLKDYRVQLANLTTPVHRRPNFSGTAKAFREREQMDRNRERNSVVELSPHSQAPS